MTPFAISRLTRRGGDIADLGWDEVPPSRPPSGIRNPSLGWRAFLVAVALALPGTIAGAVAGLFVGAFSLGCTVGGLLGAALGAAMEAGPALVAKQGPPGAFNPNEEMRTGHAARLGGRSSPMSARGRGCQR